MELPELPKKLSYKAWVCQTKWSVKREREEEEAKEAKSLIQERGRSKCSQSLQDYHMSFIGLDKHASLLSLELAKIP